MRLENRNMFCTFLKQLKIWKSLKSKVIFKISKIKITRNINTLDQEPKIKVILKIKIMLKSDKMCYYNK